VTLKVEESQSQQRQGQDKSAVSSGLEDDGPPDQEDLKNRIYEKICQFDDVQWNDLLTYLGIEEENLSGTSRQLKVRSLIDSMDRWLSQLGRKVEELNEHKRRTIEQEKQALIAKFLETPVSFNNWLEVIRKGKEILRSDPNHQAVRAQTARAYYEHAHGCRLIGERIAAIQSLTRAIELDQQPEYYGWRGINHALEDDYDEALADCDRAIEMAPDRSECYHWRAVVYTRKGDDGQAIVDITRAIEANPQRAPYYYTRCEIFRKKGG
jgi:tetratricopeptide (TPR) repeat protein